MVKKAGEEDGADDRGPKASGSARVKGNVTKEVFLSAAKDLAQLNAEADAIRQRRNTARKQFKANGIELGKLDATLKMAEWERQEVRDHFDTARTYAEWMNLPVGAQKDLWAGMDSEEIIASEWHADGWAKRLAGKPNTPPENCGVVNRPFWDNGYMLKPFVWDREGVAAAKAANTPKPAGNGGEGGGKPKAAAKAPAATGKPRGRPAAKKVAGMISPPPATHTKPDLKVVDGTPKPDDGPMPQQDPFGKTGFGVH